jgi:hypothetical protein
VRLRPYPRLVVRSPAAFVDAFADVSLDEAADAEFARVERDTAKADKILTDDEREPSVA